MIRRRQRPDNALGVSSRGAQLLKANRNRGGVPVFRSMERFITKQDKPNTQQGTRNR